MLVRIEFVTRLWIDFFNMGGIKRFLQFVQSHLHTHFQGIEITALIEQRHFKVVFDRQHFGCKFLSGKFMGIGNLLLMAAAQILLVCQTAQLAVFELAFQLGNTAPADLRKSARLVLRLVRFQLLQQFLRLPLLRLRFGVVRYDPSFLTSF